MATYSGFLFVMDETSRAQLVEGRVSDSDGYYEYVEGIAPKLYEITTRTFSDVISSPDIALKTTELFLISFDRATIVCAALVHRGRMIATAKYLVRFTHIVRFPPLHFKDLEERLGTRLSMHFLRASTGRGNRISPMTWSTLLNAIESLNPETAKAIHRLDVLRQAHPVRDASGGYATMAEEKDALALAFDFSRFPREHLLRQWEPPTGDAPAPFLQGLQGVSMLEDHIINHDAGVFGTWEKRDATIINAVEFHKLGQRLTVMNVNRTPIEKTLGVDLLYYHHRFGLFVMVQYKRMTKERQDVDEDDVKYRPVDESYLKELERIRAFRKLHPEDSGSSLGLDDYRLHTEAFYIKLCSAVVFEPLSTGLLKGMYFPLDYWELLVESPDVKGTHGGVQITFQNAKRPMNNSLFVELVQRGFIGSRLRTTDALSSMIRASLNAGRSVIAAASQPIVDAEAVHPTNNDSSEGANGASISENGSPL